MEKWTQEGKAKKSRRTVKNGTAAGRRVAGMEGGESVERHQRREKESRWRMRWMKGGVTKKRRGRNGDAKEWGEKAGNAKEGERAVAREWVNLWCNDAKAERRTGQRR